MAYPEKVSYPEKYNLRPIEEPDGQFSAENANQVKEKINKNALFHGVHDNLSALQSAFPEPPVGAFAYLLDGSHYRCVNIGWVTNESGSGSSYFKGYYTDGAEKTALEKLREAHPNSIPGARAILKVEGGNDKEALWDEDDQDWFAFEFQDLSQIEADIQNHESRISNLEENSGNTSSPAKINSFLLGYDSGLDYDPVATFTIDGAQKTDSRSVSLQASDANNDRIDTFVINLATEQIEVITGTPAENPTEPEIDFETHLKGPFVLVPAGATEPDGTDIITMYAENLGIAGGEWDTSGGASYDFDNEEDPHSGTKAIKVVGDLIINQLMGLIPDESVPVSQAKELQIWMKPITAGGDFHFTIRGKKHNGRNDSEIGPSASTFGFDPQDLSWQKIIYPIDVKLVTIDRINIVNEVEDFKFFLDDIRLLGGEGTPDASNDYVTREEMEAAIAFTQITENEFGTHPAFTNQHDLNAWLLGASGGGTNPDPTPPVLTVDNISQTGFDSTLQ